MWGVICCVGLRISMGSSLSSMYAGVSALAVFDTLLDLRVLCGGREVTVHIW